MTSEQRNTAVMRAAYGAYQKKDPTVLIDSIAEDVRFSFAAKRAHFPFGGMFRGKAGVKRAIDHIAARMTG